MSSLTTSKPLAISLRNVSKIYRLHGCQSDQLIDVLGLKRFGFKTKTPAKEFSALSNISLDVPRGHRIGIVGRNGAGKTTLLKLICGNFRPSHGEVEVNGRVQALMSTGLGFHPEYTGRENVESSLQYNGLGHDEYQKAIDGIVEFCELGDYLDQPFKTYSLGMQARLMFAAATAIHPDILIVDEVLGAGDAYFVAKSKQRVENLVNSGCTMLLVSHSMQQVLELCDEAIWLDQGKIRMRDSAFLVVKAYEEYMHGSTRQVATKLAKPSVGNTDSAITTVKSLERSDKTIAMSTHGVREKLLQEPRFVANGELSADFPYVDAPVDLKFVTAGGVSRWDSDVGLKVCGFSIVTDQGESNKLLSLKPAKVLLNLISERSDSFRCRYGLVFDDLYGNAVIRIYSPVDEFALREGETRLIEMLLNPVQLGPGEYTIGVSVLEGDELESVNFSRRYDLLGRSFSVRVETPETLMIASAGFFHTAEWGFGV